ncbi:hypothetical protein HBN50_05480 [Halobacteriovorax sp. GB3]|uniref:hypothetical protein n=1 Tax=Halobacteriovorax sp. GB3 TaxID=2719615 RepID=UPI00235FD481|nr:hypothetical protein [Halobacteriovorax sp. GB3]MDD0852538.1 hypothetical protein [Halobacteriovorax sp. GB3]
MNNKYQQLSKLLFFVFISVVQLFISYSHIKDSFIIAPIVLLSIVMRWLLLKRIHLSSDLTLIFTYIFLELSSFPTLVLYSYFENIDIHSNSIISLSMIPIALLALKVLKGKLPKNELRLEFKNSQSFYFLSFYSMTALAVVLTIISYKLGITKMGVPHPVLPFKLEPALNITRIMVLPLILCSLIASIAHKSGKFKAILPTVFYIAWSCVEMYARGSRGVVFFNSLPLLCFYALNFKLTARRIAPLFFIVPGILLTFFIGDFFRNLEVSKVDSSQSKPSIAKTFSLKTVTTMYTRVFAEGLVLNKIIQSKEKTENKEVLRKMSSVEFHTVEVDKSKDTTTHSSGITLISDGYFHYNLFGCFLALILAGLLAILNDAFFLTKKIYHPLFICFLVFIFNKINWGDGLLDFYISRSFFTISAFPLTICAIILLIYKPSQLQEKW